MLRFTPFSPKHQKNQKFTDDLVSLAAVFWLQNNPITHAGCWKSTRKAGRAQEKLVNHAPLGDFNTVSFSSVLPINP